MGKAIIKKKVEDGLYSVQLVFQSSAKDIQSIERLIDKLFQRIAELQAEIEEDLLTEDPEDPDEESDPQEEDTDPEEEEDPEEPEPDPEPEPEPDPPLEEQVTATGSVRGYI